MSNYKVFRQFQNISKFVVMKSVAESHQTLMKYLIKIYYHLKDITSAKP